MSQKEILFRLLLFFGLIGVLLGGKPMGEAALEKMGLRTSGWDKMVTSVDETLQNYEGEVGIFIKDLRTGKTYEHNADTRFLSASLIKVPIMAAVFKGIKEGRLQLNESIPMRTRYRRGGSGTFRRIRAGEKIHVSNLIYNMITRSDNTATAILIDRLGYAYLNHAFREFGLEVTRIDPVGMSLADHIHPARDNYTTPREMASLLEMIYDRELVSDGLSDLMLQILKDAESPTRLRRDLPEEWDLARKTGLLRKNCHDVGILFAKDSDYIICVLTQKNKTYRQAKGFIASLGKSAYSVLGHS